jgi:hypothetical protein
VTNFEGGTKTGGKADKAHQLTSEIKNDSDEVRSQELSVRDDWRSASRTATDPAQATQADDARGTSGPRSMPHRGGDLV